MKNFLPRSLESKEKSRIIKSQINTAFNSLVPCRPLATELCLVLLWTKSKKMDYRKTYFGFLFVSDERNSNVIMSLNNNFLALQTFFSFISTLAGCHFEIR